MRETTRPFSVKNQQLAVARLSGTSNASKKWRSSVNTPISVCFFAVQCLKPLLTVALLINQLCIELLNTQPK